MVGARRVFSSLTLRIVCLLWLWQPGVVVPSGSPQAVASWAVETMMRATELQLAAYARVRHGVGVKASPCFVDADSWFVSCCVLAGSWEESSVGAVPLVHSQRV